MMSEAADQTRIGPDSEVSGEPVLAQVVQPTPITPHERIEVVDILRGFAIFGILAVNLLVVPGVFLLATGLSRLLSGLRSIPMRRLFVDYAYALVPMGLGVWIAFSFSFVFVNGSYALSVISDPFGWGWDLFGTRSFPWTPVLVGAMPYLQTMALIGGLVFSIYVAHRIGEQHDAGRGWAIRGLLPIAAFLVTVTVAFLWLYLG